MRFYTVFGLWVVAWLYGFSWSWNIEGLQVLSSQPFGLTFSLGYYSIRFSKSMCRQGLQKTHCAYMPLNNARIAWAAAIRASAIFGWNIVATLCLYGIDKGFHGVVGRDRAVNDRLSVIETNVSVLLTFFFFLDSFFYCFFCRPFYRHLLSMPDR